MPDVGILNLQIRDDSAKAAEGLKQLVTRLKEMKIATSKIRLGTVASGIKRINDELSKVQPSAIYKLKQLADVLEKIGSISGNVGGIRISFGGRGQSIEDIATQMQAARDAVAQTTAGFEQIGQRVQEDVKGAEAFANTMGRVNEIVQQTGFSANTTAEQFSKMFRAMNSMRMSRSLGDGSFALGDGTGGSGADWTYWKDGAIEVEGTVTDAMDAIRIGSGEAIPLLTGVVDATAEIASSVQEMAEESETFANTASEFDSVAQSVQQTTEALQEYNEAIEFARRWNASGASAGGYKGQESADIEYVNSLIESASQADLLAMRIDALRDKLYQMAGSGKATGDQIARMVSQIQGLQEKLDKLNSTTEDVKKSFSEIMAESGGLNGAFKRMFPTISGLLTRFKQIVKYRMLRAVIRHITEGFSEGVQNVYQYSKAVGTSLAPAMDAGATALQQMKNSIGAAVAPVIQALVPVLQNVAYWFINLINYANQFFALMNGQNTWTRALPESAEAYEKTAKNAKAASKATKDLLADWDELNIIQSNSGGGTGSGTGKTAKEYSQMFEEVSEFDRKVKDAINFINEHLGGIPEILKKAGIILLGWKFSKAFGGFLGTIGKLVAGVTVVKLGLDLSYGSGFDAGQKGYFDSSDLIGAIGGSLATAVGGYLIGTGLAGAAGGTYGIVIGLSVGIAMSLYGWIKGKQDAADAVKWGNLHLTAEQVEEYVKKQFTFDIEAETKVLHSHVEFMQTARDETDAAIETFETNLKKVKIGLTVDSDEAGVTVKTAIGSAQEAVKAVQREIDTLNESIKVSMELLPLASVSDDGSGDLLAGLMVAEQPLREYMEMMGKELADAMLAGEKAGWKDGTEEAALALMMEQQEIYNKAKQYAQEAQLEANLSNSTEGVVKDGVFDRDAALAALGYQQQQLNEYKQTALEKAKMEQSELLYFEGLARAAAERAASKGQIERASDLERSADELHDRALRHVAETEAAVELKLEESKRNIARDWAEILQTVYGMDFDKEIMEGTAPLTQNLLGMDVETGFAQNLRNAKNKGDFINQWLLAYIGSMDQNGIITSAINDFGMNVWDLLSEGARKNLFMNTADILGGGTEGSHKATEALMSAFGLSHKDIWEYVLNYDEYPYKAKTNGTTVSDLIGATFTPPEEAVPLEVEVEVKPEIENMNEAIESIYSDIRQSILKSDVDNKIDMLGSLVDLYNSGDLDTLKTWKQKINEFGIVDAYDQLLNYINGDDWTLGSNTNFPKGRLIASAGVSDMGFAPYSSYEPAGSEPFSSGFDLEAEVEDHETPEEKQANIRLGTNGLLEALNSILTVAQAINRKEFTVNITPNSAFGNLGAKSAEAYGRITG